MKVSVYVRDADPSSLAKAQRFDSKGWLDKLYVQVHGNEPDLIARNRAAFPTWQRTFGAARVAAWFIGSADAGADAALVEQLDAELEPRVWVPNDEKPSEGRDRSAMLVACMGGHMGPVHSPNAIIVSTTGTPSRTAMPYRDYVTHGAQVEIQGYDGDGVNLPPEGIGALIEDAFRLEKLVITAAGSPAWWVRLYLSNLLGSGGKIIKRWTWAQATAFDPGVFPDGTGQLRLVETGNTWGTPARETAFGYELVGANDDEEEVLARTVRNRRNGRRVGHVFGIAPYPAIRVALSVERAITPEALADLARSARVAGASIRGVGIYTLGNLTDEQMAAVAAVA